MIPEHLMQAKEMLCLSPAWEREEIEIVVPPAAAASASVLLRN